ncbi:unnamed protein product [Protopolystoma xenopodis]|uniref:Uncharacterized protein n=1 Tax=Protopolystoma xenopodis TaxID=117903 RepID=A0A3S5BJ70_9PLAT|nr:unnamed protein product [Protopolystoma xenopodis]
MARESQPARSGEGMAVRGVEGERVRLCCPVPKWCSLVWFLRPSDPREADGELHLHIVLWPEQVKPEIPRLAESCLRLSHWLARRKECRSAQHGLTNAGTGEE